MAARDDLTPDDAVAGLLGAGESGARIGIAVSGGGDSLALLLAAKTWAVGSGGTLRAVTVDHGLRPEAASEARFVADLCEGRDIAHDTITLDLPDGPNLQARARTARYGALRDWASDNGVGPVLLGHTRDDVVETLVMRLRRGVGLDGLAEMPRTWRDDHGQDWARPLLDLSRAALRDYLAHAGVTPVEDPSNEDKRFERVEIRQALRTLGWTDGALARSASHLALVRQSYDARLEEKFEACFRAVAGDLMVDRDTADRLMRNEPDSWRRMLLAALHWIGHSDAPRQGEQTRLLQMLSTPTGGTVTLAGCRIDPTGGSIRIGRELAACHPAVPAREVWDGRWQVTGPLSSDHVVGPLGEDIAQTPWRDGPLPRHSAMATPAVRRGGVLVCAPVVDPTDGWSARLVTRPAAAFRRAGAFSN